MIRLKYSRVHKINISMVDAHNAGLSDEQIEKCMENVRGVIGVVEIQEYSVLGKYLSKQRFPQRRVRDNRGRNRI